MNALKIEKSNTIHPLQIESELKTKNKSTSDSRWSKIFTFKDFKWAYQNPFTTVFQRGNSYVTEQWSEEYFLAGKHGIKLIKESTLNTLSSFAKTCRMIYDATFKKNSEASFKKAKESSLDALGHLLNTLIIALEGVLFIEGGNLIKGIIGMGISSTKLIYHTILSPLYLTAALIPLISGDSKRAKQFVFEAGANFAFVLKDLVSIITCFGHSIPSWLPVLLLFTCPVAGIALSIIKTTSKFTGSFDLIAYGGTGVLLYSKAKIAQRNIDKNPSDIETLKAINEWKKLKKELSPTQSFEGGLLTMYGVRILCEGATTLIDAFTPGIGTIAKYISYGLQGLMGTILLGLNLKNRKKAKSPPSNDLHFQQQKPTIKKAS